MQLSNRAVPSTGHITALLGPTNTGKTHYALERMLGYNSGVIGFPLRLLARENYDRVVRIKGQNAVALITGEEKIVPRHASYFICTTESMPVNRVFEFLAVDEIQLCADPERGHIFTDRLLRARGSKQTMFMGADTIRPLMAGLVPGIEFISRPRLSRLEWRGFKKVSRLPGRTAIVAFSMNDVYGIAELIRRQRGGTAVVLGALSPRTRNRQVEMYQAGEVDFMVATDAIGMGLNMNINHVALAGTRKFDGRRVRELCRAEVGQVAGRAGRYRSDGTFGVTGPLRTLDEETVEALETHQFDSIKALYWRNSLLDYSSLKTLLRSLEQGSGVPVLARGRPADDYLALAQLARRDSVQARAGSKASVRLLWDVCQIPDFRKTLSETHQDLIASVYEHITDRGYLPAGEVRAHIDRLDKTEGDVDTLMARIAHIRTWTYITHKAEWLQDAGEWQERARAVEDKLSDALHESLLRRFVDRRSAVLIKALEEGRTLLAGVRADGQVIVEGENVGHLEGFCFVARDNSGAAYKTVMAAARNALKPEIKRRLKNMLNADDKQFRLTSEGEILYQPQAGNPLPGQPVARVKKGPALLQPEPELVQSDLLTDQDKAAATEKLKTWLHNHIRTVLEPLVMLDDKGGEEEISGPARGIAFQLYESLGIVPRAMLENLIKDLDQDARRQLRRKGIKLGPVLVFLPALNKPAGVRLRALLWRLWDEKPLPAPVPHDGVTSFAVEGLEDLDPRYYRAIGYPVYGPRAIRVDMLDRVISAVYDSAQEGKFKARHEMAEWLGCSIPDLYAVLEAMGHKKIHDPAEQETSQKEESDADTVPDADKTEETPQAATEINDTASPKEETPPVQEAADAAATEQVGEKEVQSAEKTLVPPAEKPELATFALRRGKAYGRARPPAQQQKKRQEDNKNNRPRKRHDSPKSHKGQNRRQSITSAGAQRKMENSPFAVLKDLKVKSDEKS